MMTLLQRLIEWLKKLPLAIHNFTLEQKLAILFAFFGTASLVYAGVTVVRVEDQAGMADTSFSLGNEFVTPTQASVSSKATSSSKASTPPILVDVSGAVDHPGVYELQQNNRVSDAVNLAGGFTKTADRSFINTTINLALPVQDAMKIYIPFKGERVGEQQSTINPTPLVTDPVASSNPLNVNTASATELDMLKGIGAARAQQIVLNRPYIDLKDFRAKSGLTPSLVDQISSQLIF